MEMTVLGVPINLKKILKNRIKIYDFDAVWRVADDSSESEQNTGAG